LSIVEEKMILMTERVWGYYATGFWPGQWLEFGIFYANVMRVQD